MGTGMDMRDDTRKPVRTLWSWLCGASWPRDRNGRGRPEHTSVAATPSLSSPMWGDGKNERRASLQDDGSNKATKGGILLQFPVRGEALLVNLAELLRRRVANPVANRGAERDPLLLTMSRCSGSRLSIDRRAYVEFDADRLAYHVAIEAAPDTTIALDTTDFDAVVDFVAQYIAERLSEPPAVGAGL